MAFSNKLKKRALRLTQQALNHLLVDERRAARVATAVGVIQRGKQKFDRAQRTVMHQVSFATKADLKDVGNALGGLRRRVQALHEKLSAL